MSYQFGSTYASKGTISYGNLAALNAGLNRLALSMWVKGEDSVLWAWPMWGQLFFVYQAEGDESDWIFEFAGAKGTFRTGVGAIPADVTWRHLAFRYDGTQAVAADRFKFWVNGAVRAGTITSAFAPSLITTSADPFSWGGGAYADIWRGREAEGALWTGTLPSDAQIGHLAAGYKPNQIGLAPFLYASLSNSANANAEVGGYTATLTGEVVYSTDHPVMQAGLAPGVGAPVSTGFRSTPIWWKGPGKKVGVA